VDRSSDIFATRTAPDAGNSLPGYQNPAGDSPQANWALHQLSTNLDAASSDPFLPGAFGQVLVGLTVTEIEVMMQAGDQLAKLFTDAMSGKPLSDLLAGLFEVVGLTVLDSVENVTLTAVDLGVEMVAALRDLLAGRWDVPVLTPLYEQIICQGNGSKLSLLDLVALLATIPATVLGKRITKHNLFSTAQIAAVDGAHDWDTVVRALSQPTPKAMLGANANGTQTAAQVLQLVSGCLRLASSRLGVLKDVLDAATPDETAVTAKLLGKPKLACDWVLYTIGLISASLLLPANSSDRQNLDLAITVAGGIPPALEVVRQIRNLVGSGGDGKMLVTIDLGNPPDGGPMPSPAPTDELGFDDITRYVEVAYGVTVLVLAFVSTGLQTREPTPAQLNFGEDRTLLGLKAVQNILAASSAIFAFGLAVPTKDDPEVEPLIVGLRAGFAVNRAFIQFGRSVAQLTLGAIDLEGVVP
jgi:hypothetical protein